MNVTGVPEASAVYCRCKRTRPTRLLARASCPKHPPSPSTCLTAAPLANERAAVMPRLLDAAPAEREQPCAFGRVQDCDHAKAQRVAALFERLFGFDDRRVVGARSSVTVLIDRERPAGFWPPSPAPTQRWA